MANIDPKYDYHRDTVDKWKIAKDEHDVNLNAKKVVVVGGSTSVKVSFDDVLAKYMFVQKDKADLIAYYGYMDKDGNWLIKKYDKTTEDTKMTYANVSNNDSYITYADAWTNHLTLTYENPEDLTFIDTDAISIDIYSLHRVADIPSGGNMFILGRTNGKKVTNSSLLIKSDTADGISIKFFEDSTYTVIGDSVSGVNRDRTSSNNHTMLLYQNPIIDVEGTLLSEIEILGDKKAGDSGELAEPFILKNSSNYVYKITNNNPGTVRISIAFFWEEK